MRLELPGRCELLPREARCPLAASQPVVQRGSPLWKVQKLVRNREKESVCVLPFPGWGPPGQCQRQGCFGREQPLVSAAWGSQALALLKCCRMLKQRELL